MKANQINQLISQEAFPDSPGKTELIETHISWIILSTNYAFKIKKPVQFSFLDFSTLEKRKYYCEEELSLNRRLTLGIYLEVVPITLEKKGKICIDGNGSVIDYCVQMKRMNNDYRLDKLLREDRVSSEMIFQLAKKLADFHQSTSILSGKVNSNILLEDFADILNFQSEIEAVLGKQKMKKIKKGVEFAHQILDRLSSRIDWREQNGWVRDCHGDLHAANIIFENEPIIFDCIEFNEHFRYLDLLSELAFLYMDLDFYNQGTLAQCFLNKYLETFNCMLTTEDHLLFIFYKLYRANIKVKVNVLKAKQKENRNGYQAIVVKVKRYMELFEQYMED